MTHKNAIKIFEEKKVRAVWDDQTEEWYLCRHSFSFLRHLKQDLNLKCSMT